MNSPAGLYVSRPQRLSHRPVHSGQGTSLPLHQRVRDATLHPATEPDTLPPANVDSRRVAVREGRHH